MNTSSGTARFPINFILLYVVSSGVTASYNAFFPVYLNQIGFSKTMIGTLMAIAPLMLLVSQPVWGMAGDRSRSINRLFCLIMGGTGLAALGYLLSSNFYYLFIMIAIFSFFNSPMLAFLDVLTLRSIEHTNWKYSNIRLSMSIGFACFSVLAGFVAKWNITMIFPLIALYAGTAVLVTLMIPNVEGYQKPHNRVSPLALLKNRELSVLMIFSFILMMTLGFFYSFFPVYFREIGADSDLLGIYWFISAIVEVPFLLTANWITGKLGIRGTLILSAAIMGVRWLVLFLTADVTIVMLTSVMHGFSFIVMAYCMVTYISHVPKELKSSGQSFYYIFGSGIPRMIASMAGGLASDQFGIRPVFLICSIINFCLVLFMGARFLFIGRMARPATTKMNG
jgi:PPP family 3-phenylpropionic acid transporter